MKVAISSDLHLNPEFSFQRFNYPKKLELYSELDNRYGEFHNNFLRWLVLEEILENCRKEDIKNLIIAGDLFDKKTGLTEIDPLFGKYRDISIHIIAGNHDYFLSKKYFSSNLENVFVYEEPTVIDIGGILFAFVPYKKDSSFTEEISKIKPLVNTKQNLILISHSDIMAECYYDGEEEKIYFPITKKDLNLLNPTLTFLGHIHQAPIKPIYNNIFYTGSPCACNSNETGIRTYIILDLSLPIIPENVIRKKLKRGILFYENDFVMLPLKDEAKFIEEEINRILYSIAVDVDYISLEDRNRRFVEEDFNKEYNKFFNETTNSLKYRVCLNLKVKGLTYEGKQFVESKIKECLDKKVLDKYILTDNLMVCDNQDISIIINEIVDEINKTFYSIEGFKPYKDKTLYNVTYKDYNKILSKALELII